MSWDPLWEKIFNESGWGSYPNEEFIRFMARHFYHAPDRKAIRVLEIGCGNGSNIWYLAREGFSAHGIDGSETAIRMAGGRMAGEGLIADLKAGDVVNLTDHYPEAYFDAVADIGCLQCNRLEVVEDIVANCRAVLKPGARMFALLVTTGSWGDGLGTKVEPGSYLDITEGPLKDRGINHFFSREELGRVWKDFDDLRVEYVSRTFNDCANEYRTWTVDAVV